MPIHAPKILVIFKKWAFWSKGWPEVLAGSQRSGGQESSAGTRAEVPIS